MKTKPQGRLEGSVLGELFASRPGIIASNWVFQGMRYMNGSEIALKIGIDLALATILARYAFPNHTPFVAISTAILIAHTVNWVLNGHFFVLMRYVVPIPKSELQFEAYIARLGKSAQRFRSIDAVAIFGSYCRGRLHNYSDLDVRVIATPGVSSALAASVFCFAERLIAFVRLFPLDIYCCSDLTYLDRLRRDEAPVVLLDRSGRLSARYGTKPGSEA